MTHFVDGRHELVTDALDGLLAASTDRLARLDGFPEIKVVVRTDWDRSRVAVISGGGAGHEPTHAGFVGSGLLTAAVSGEIFASPSVDAVLAAILAVTGDAGCLLVVKNYTGDRLNFGLAAERARAAGVAVETIVVADDIALPGAAARGIAGTLFVHKIAGAAAEKGAGLPDVAEVARRAAAAIVSLGVSVSGARIPFRPEGREFTVGSGELGLGIHGEPGAEAITVESARAVVERMAALLSGRVGGGPVALLLNNLGGVSALEMGIVQRDLLATPLGARAELLVGPAALMTSLEMKGFSISALPLSDEWRAALTAPAEPTAAWPAVRAIGAARVLPVPTLGGERVAVASEHAATRSLLTAAARALIEGRDRLDGLDARVGDGDTGSTFAHAAQRLLDQLDTLPLAEPDALFTTLSGLLARTMGGSSGVLLSIFFAAAGSAAADGSSTPAALDAGVVAMRRYGGAEPGERTMLDALVPAIGVLLAGGWLPDAAAAARVGAEATASITSTRAGRSAYLPAEHLLGAVDPGAAAVVVVFDALAGAKPPGAKLPGAKLPGAKLPGGADSALEDHPRSR
ncbi:MAG: dihydroxyacetone kinase subunit DhaK [Actinobacteria bacterium]|nr:dihydroxyacetone kinase subunit DhaK [Actinomycetota bacterium]